MTQADRVLHALRLAGEDGVTQYDLSGPIVIDGGARIMRLAARILELKAKGHVIQATGHRDGHVIYRLAAAEPPAPFRAAGQADAQSAAVPLFAPPAAGPRGMYDPYTEEAA